MCQSSPSFSVDITPSSLILSSSSCLSEDCVALVPQVAFSLFDSPRFYPQGTVLLSLHLYSLQCPHSHGFENQARVHVSHISFSFPSIHLSTCLRDSSTWKPYIHLKLKNLIICLSKNKQQKWQQQEHSCSCFFQFQVTGSPSTLPFIWLPELRVWLLFLQFPHSSSHWVLSVLPDIFLPPHKGCPWQPFLSSHRGLVL